MSERETIAVRVDDLLVAVGLLTPHSKQEPWFARLQDALRQPPAPVQVTEEMLPVAIRAYNEANVSFVENEQVTRMRRALEAALQAGVPSGWRYMLDKYKPGCCLGIENCDGSHYGPSAPSHSQADCCMIRAMLAAAPAPGEGR